MAINLFEKNTIEDYFGIILGLLDKAGWNLGGNGRTMDKNINY